MTNDIGRHIPTPEFRASLERRLLRELRRPARYGEVLRKAALIAFGLFLGVGTQMASAQVQEARQRSELERSLMVERELAALRLQLARTEVERAQKAFSAGALSRQSLLTAEAEARAMEVHAARLELDLAEVRLTAAAPRDELWAPLVGDRDFVSDRARMAALVAQQRLQAAEAVAVDVERGHRVGSVGDAALRDARLDVARARMEFQSLATRLQLREQFLKEGLSSEEVVRREQRAQLMFELEHGQVRLQAAEAQLRDLQEKAHVGAIDDLTLKRAELEMLELRAQLRQLQSRYAAMRGKLE